MRLHTEVAAGRGRRRLEGIAVLDRRSGRISALPMDALFILIGAAPTTEWLQVERDAWGFIQTGSDVLAGTTWPLERPPFPLETSIPGVFAIGDVRSRSVKRVASAVGDGSVVMSYVHQYLAPTQVPHGRS